MLTVLVIVMCVCAAVANLAVLRDKSLVELQVKESSRWIKIAGYVIAAMACVYYALAEQQHVHSLLDVALLLVAFGDAVSASTKLFPEAAVRSCQSKVESTPRP